VCVSVCMLCSELLFVSRGLSCDPDEADSRDFVEAVRFSNDSRTI
jgi:hypothetical protein